MKIYNSVNNWLVDTSKNTINHSITGECKRLGEFQIRLLNTLLQKPDSVFTNEELIRVVWDNRIVGSNSLPNAIHALRTAIGDDGKNQKIIKTITKKGYLLNGSYCQGIDKELTQSSSPDEISKENNNNENPEQEKQTNKKTKKHLTSIKCRKGTQLNKTFITLSALIIACFFYFKYPLSKNGSIYIKEIVPGTYENIKIFSMERQGTITWRQEEAYSVLKELLYKLDIDLKEQSIQMNIYYSSPQQQILNYTLKLFNKCDNKQLVMTIYHWRTNTSELKEIISSETRRELNDLAPCK